MPSTAEPRDSPEPRESREPRAVRPLRAADRTAVVRLDGRLTGQYKPAYWKARFGEFVGAGHLHGRLGLAVGDGRHLRGYLLGEVRAFEFGSPPCGWILAVGVDPEQAHHGIGSALVTEASRQFLRDGVATVRTMVGRTDLPMLAFFRANGFVGGRFTQLELDLVPGAAAPPPPEAARQPRRRR
jgi:ribosomal protein S18 acetylase RimI-like enzyme